MAKKYRLVKHYDKEFSNFYFIDVFMKPKFSKEKKKWYRIGCEKLENCLKNYPKALVINKYIQPNK